MAPGLSLNEFMEYTDWERGKWEDWFRQRGDSALAVGVGEHGDGRFQNIGELVRHIFSAETGYIDRLANRPLTVAASIPSNSVEALFAFGRQSRAYLREYVNGLPEQNWDVFHKFNFFNNLLRATPRKLLVHVLMHEIRHWAQVGTLFRLNGMPMEFHDFLFSPVLGGELKKVSG